MAFAAGDRVVYPSHGATVVDRVETVEVLGSTREYLVLHFTDAALTLRVPSDAAGAVGLRDVISAEDADEVLCVLRRSDVRVPSNWSRRFKNHTSMIKSGDVYQLAEVVRNLSRHNGGSRLSTAESRMLARARQVLASELCLALDEDEARVGALLNDALAAGAGPGAGPPADRREDDEAADG
jgi:CarD family transcriptional regulator